MQACVPVQVSALTPGYTQLVLLGDLSFIHLNLPSGGWSGVAVLDGAAVLSYLHPLLQRPVLHILVGDFNCVIHQIDMEDLSFLSFVMYRKFSQELLDTAHLFGYVDAFCVVFLAMVQFSRFGHGKSSSRLDCVYLPPFLESCPRVAF